MASSTDFHHLFDKYQLEGAPNGISIVKYCQLNGVVYSHFERWYKKYRAGVVLPVEFVDRDSLAEPTEPQHADSPIRISQVTLLLSNGLQLNQQNISYPALRQIIEKLEALC